MKIYQTITAVMCALFVFGCDAARQTSSPTETLRTFIEASGKKDIEKIKKTLSKGTMDIIGSSAKAQKTTVDELLKKENSIPLKEMSETLNEKIEGDTASIEVKNIVTGDFDPVPFVKEDGVWKMELDVYMRNLQKKMKDDMRIPLDESQYKSNSPQRDGDTPPVKETPNESDDDD